MSTLPIALYCRVSTTQQNVASQLHELHAYAGRRGLAAVEYTDLGVSGRKDSRPAFDRMLLACRRREVSVVAATALDRLGRSLAHVAAFGAELQALGIELVTLREGIATSTVMGQAMFGMAAVFSQLEGALLRERSLLGQAAARRRGARFGRPRRLDAEGRQRLLRLRQQGHSLRYCAEQLGCGIATLSRELRRA
jgi:DNA invertase Pin-like site-specific DNA recombinase